MRDYTHLFRSKLPLNEPWPEHWDFFVSAYNSTSRVLDVFEKVNATRKVWIIHNEYGYDAAELPKGGCASFSSTQATEDGFIRDFFAQEMQSLDPASSRLCIDITGFMRPHMMFLVALLLHRGFKEMDILYSEPEYYTKREETRFSEGFAHEVREVAGFSGVVNNSNGNDVLVIGAGYEDRLIKEVADDKERAKKIVILGFPSLRADMYQQNALRAHLASDALGDLGTNKHFAPANDPFVTASVISQLVERENSIKRITNLYLSPVATKAQALGFVLFYLGECVGREVSIIFAFNSRYARDSSQGISTVWKYTLEFPPFTA